MIHNCNFEGKTGQEDNNNNCKDSHLELTSSLDIEIWHLWFFLLISRVAKMIISYDFCIKFKNISKIDGFKKFIKIIKKNVILLNEKSAFQTEKKNRKYSLGNSSKWVFMNAYPYVLHRVQVFRNTCTIRKRSKMQEAVHVAFHFKWNISYSRSFTHSRHIEMRAISVWIHCLSFWFLSLLFYFLTSISILRWICYSAYGLLMCMFACLNCYSFVYICMGFCKLIVQNILDKESIFSSLAFVDTWNSRWISTFYFSHLQWIYTFTVLNVQHWICFLWSNMSLKFCNNFK